MFKTLNCLNLVCNPSLLYGTSLDAILEFVAKLKLCFFDCLVGKLK